MIERYSVFTTMIAVAGCVVFDAVGIAEPAPWTETGTTGETSAATSASTTEPTSSDAGELGSTGDAEGSTGAGDVCGDGIIGPSEECEDGSTSCTNCMHDRVVFVSSTLHGAWTIGGLAGGDGHCFALASSVSLPNPTKFRAWLSDSVTDARDHVELSLTSRYVLPVPVTGAEDPPFVALGAEFLSTTPQLLHGIDRDEAGNFIDDFAWTGTSAGGTKRTHHCVDWTTLDGDERGWFGSTSDLDASWTVSSVGFNPAGCNIPARLYCFEVK